MTQKEKIESTFSFYKRFAMYRESAGGVYDAFFFGDDLEKLAKVDTSQIRILKIKPSPGAQGVTEPSMKIAEGEWRVYSGKGLNIVDAKNPKVKLFEWDESGQYHRYAGFEPVQAINYLTSKALYIKGLLDNELTEDFRQLLLEHLKGGRTLSETIMDLRELFEPWIGDPTKIAPSGQVGINTPPGTKSPDNLLQAYRLENMIRTPIVEAYNQGRLAIGDAADDYVIGYEYSAILDTRTTEICFANDGLLIRKDDPRLIKLTPPVHFQCRSLLVYVTAIDTPVEWSDDEELDAAVARIQDGFS